MTDRYDVSATDLRPCPACGITEGHHTAACPIVTAEWDAQIAADREARNAADALDETEPMELGPAWIEEDVLPEGIPLDTCPACGGHRVCCDDCEAH